MAARYLASIESAGRGIVLLHDRVGHVGSRYALDLARALVPALEAHGYVFAAPVLRFSPAAERARAEPTPATAGGVVDPERSGALRADLNGDGRPDTCERRTDGIACALATARGFAEPSVWATFEGAGAAFATGRLRLADVSGDGRADLCVESGPAVVCGLAP
jgi:hypothetical protein